MSTRVVVGMSGGVDSSVTALLLKQQGYEVIGMMLRLWSQEGKEDSNRCCTPDAMALARRVAAKLEIPFFAVDGRTPFYESVVRSFLDGYASGETPNPCLVCNRQIRWGLLLEHAQAHGAEYLATGHYARLQTGKGGRTELLRGVDRSKDQSYVLHVLDQSQLAHSLFPLGGLTKSAVRALALAAGLPSASRPDSQDLCFLAGEDYRAFLQRHAPESLVPGEIVDLEGNVIGRHSGLASATIGQRKGLGASAHGPLYVLEKDVVRNRLVVGPASELGSSGCNVRAVRWISGEAPAGEFEAEVKTRYTAREAAARVTPSADGQACRVEFEAPARGLTPGQAAVFYNGEVVLGGGTIATTR